MDLMNTVYSQLQYGTDDAHFQHILKTLGHTSGFDINALDDTHNSLLHHACGEFFLNTCLIAFLLNHGADPCCVNSNGVTPLETLIFNGGLVEDALQHFLRNGADLRTVPPDKIPTHFRAFCARMCEHRDQREHCDAATHTLGRVLIEHIRANNLDGVRCVLAANPKLSSYGDGHYLSVVHHACGDTVDTDIFQEILSYTPPLNVVDLDGNTPLHVLNLSQWDKTQRLLQHNCPPQLFQRRSHLQRTALEHCIVDMEINQLERRLLEEVVVHYTPTQLSHTLRETLTRFGGRTGVRPYRSDKLKSARILIKCGADINHPNSRGKTLLHTEAEVEQDNPKIEQLLELGADWTI